MRVFYAFVLVFLFSGCSNKHSSPQILHESEMRKVLWDVMLAEEYANIRVARDSGKKIDNERMDLYNKVFQLHKIKKEDFNASMKYYASRPDKMKVIIDSLSAKSERERRTFFQPK